MGTVTKVRMISTAVTNVISLLVVLGLADSKYFSLCDFKRELQALGVPREFLGPLVCLGQHISGLNTEVRQGILGIKEDWGCLGNFRDSSLKDDVECALFQLRLYGIQAWPHASLFCTQNKLHTKLDACGLEDFVEIDFKHDNEEEDEERITTKKSMEMNSNTDYNLNNLLPWNYRPRPGYKFILINEADQTEVKTGERRIRRIGRPRSGKEMAGGQEGLEGLEGA